MALGFGAQGLGFRENNSGPFLSTTSTRDPMIISASQTSHAKLRQQPISDKSPQTVGTFPK